MKTITDEAVLAFLLALKDKTTLLDPSGKAIGHFHPIDPKDDELYAAVVRVYDAEELARRKANPGKGLTGDEVRARLRALKDETGHPLRGDGY